MCTMQSWRRGQWCLRHGVRSAEETGKIAQESRPATDSDGHDHGGFCLRALGTCREITC